MTSSHWNLIGCFITFPLVRYHTAVFFRNVRLTALSFPVGNIRRTFKNVPITFFFFCS
jgi:hypothetical protein